MDPLTLQAARELGSFGVLVWVVVVLTRSQLTLLRAMLDLVRTCIADVATLKATYPTPNQGDHHDPTA